MAGIAEESFWTDLVNVARRGDNQTRINNQHIFHPSVHDRVGPDVGDVAITRLLRNTAFPASADVSEQMFSRRHLCLTFSLAGSISPGAKLWICLRELVSVDWKQFERN